MNKWTLACLATAVLANPLHAMHLAPDESGQVLLFPYYTVNGDHDTYFTIASTSSYGSLVKVRFLDARRGRPVLDLNVFLAPYDSWTAVIAQTSADAPPVLRTSDATCTVPAVPAEGLRFTTAGFDGTGELPADDLPHDVARTREGSIEVISGGTMGAIRTGCASWPDGVLPGMGAPDNALSGSAAIIDVPNGEYYAYNATAIADFTDQALMATAQGPLQPSLAQASHTIHYFADGAGSSNFGRVGTAEMRSGIDAVTALLMADTLSNDFLVSPALGATTDWVLTYPTRRFYVDPVYATLIAGSIGTSGDQQWFFVDRFDRDGGADDPVIGLSLPYDAVNVLTFAHDGSAGSLFDSQFATLLQVVGDTGVVRLRTAKQGSQGPAIVTDSGRTKNGSPVIGFMAYNIVNANALPGRLSNYGATFRHHTTECDAPPLNLTICRRW